MVRQRDIRWLEVLDFERALKNVRTDLIGDWYRDPWGWPEFAWVVKYSQDIIDNRLKASDVWRCHPINVPKENFAFRPAVILDPMDRICYQAIVDKLSCRLIGELSPWVYGWRLLPKNPTEGCYASNNYQWQNYRSRMIRLSHTFDYGLKCDIVSYFASIDIDKISEVIRTRSGTNKLTNRLCNFLKNWNRVPDRTGLPQRSLASSILANMYLKPVDDLLESYGISNGSYAVSRWMDDILLFSNAEGILRKAQVDLQQVLHKRGLDMNFAKTKMLDGEKLINHIRRISHSGIERGIQQDPLHADPLMDLIDSLLEQPEHANRTSISFTIRRMRSYNLLEKVEDFIEKAHRMPHVADHLARLFRDSNAWHDLTNWYIKYSKMDWATFGWSVAQLGTMFPSSTPKPELIQHFGELLSQGTKSLPLISLAAQRLASWDTDTARVAIREAQQISDHPLKRRSLALAALTANEEREFVRQMLTEYEENQVTLKMLENTGWKTPKIVADFN